MYCRLAHRVLFFAGGEGRIVVVAACLNQRNLSQFAGRNQLFRPVILRHEAADMRHHEFTRGALCRLDHLFGILKAVGDGFFNQHMLACMERGDYNILVVFAEIYHAYYVKVGIGEFGIISTE